MPKCSFAIGIPTINRADLLNAALEKYLRDFPSTQIFVLDNGQQFLRTSERITILRPEKNLGVAASWNLLCTKIFEQHQHALILNDDIYFGKKETSVRQFIEVSLIDPVVHFSVSQQCWCAFLLPRSTFQKVGFFDEGFFPAYFEDNDYEYRLKLQWLTMQRTDFLNPKTFRNSQSMAKDPTLGQGFMSNRQRYQQKWGGLPGKEQYLNPII
jgi:GT2 family glycosyltransferase